MSRSLSSPSTVARGVQLERLTAALLRKMRAYPLVVRSAGSRGIVDIVAVGNDGSVLGVTCKAQGQLQKKERDALGRLARRMPETFHLWLSRYGITKLPILEPLTRGKATQRHGRGEGAGRIHERGCSFGCVGVRGVKVGGIFGGAADSSER